MPVPVVAAGRGAGCGAQPGLRGSRPRSLSASRSRGRAGGSCSSGAESSAGTAVSRSRGAHGPSPRLPGALWGRFPTCRAVRLLWDLGTAFVEVIRGLAGASARALLGCPEAAVLGLGSSPRYRVYLESDMWWS